ncbi:hypothetical protein SAMN05444418_12022 [Bacteroides uniformis]|nr:hypothetical protein SAMN05444418_12022 [Bacteroides uniformis]
MRLLFLCDWCIKVYNWVSLLALLGVILSYQIIGTAFEWALCGNFFLAVQDFRMGIPGMLIQWFGGYALLKAIAKK